MIYKITKFEVIIILLLFIITPMILICFYNIKYSNLNNYNLVSKIYSIIFLIVLSFQILFKRDYLPAIFNCHQKRDRAFGIILRFTGICNRCFGILLGIILCPIITIIKYDYYYLLLLMLPLIIDGTLQYKSNYMSNNFKRIITGILFGFGFICLITITNVIFFDIAFLIVNLFYNLIS